MRILTLLLLVMTLSPADAQVPLTTAYVDSVTYQAYMVGDWDRVLETGKLALKNGIDFKYLQQRMGYAYFLKSDYYASMKHYEKALKQDPSDETSLLYLHYAGLETGNTAYARHYASKLSTEVQRNNHQRAFRPVSALDFEYNYQWNKELNRTDPNYQRIGLSTDLGYSLNVYQTLSKFSQKADYADAFNEYRSDIQQNEYYILVSKSLTSNFGVDIGYHSIKTTFHTDVWDLTLNELAETYAPQTYNGNLWFGDLHYKWNRLHLGVSTSYLNLDYNHVLQSGLHLGLAVPGSHNLFINNALYRMQDDNDQWLVSKHSIGMLFFKKFWIELSKTFGSQNNFVDGNGMYLYNSFDPTSSKTGIGLNWFANNHLIVSANFALETKQNSYLLTNYNQNSLTGGIVWKF